MTAMFRTTPTLCKYPDCKAVAKKSWALVPICPGHHQTIYHETLNYYANKFGYPYRHHFLKIEPLIKESRATYFREINFVPNRNIEDLDFSIRTYSMLKRAGINKENTLRKMSYQEITNIKNIGRKSVEEIESILGIEFQPSKEGGNH